MSDKVSTESQQAQDSLSIPSAQSSAANDNGLYFIHIMRD